MKKAYWAGLLALCSFNAHSHSLLEITLSRFNQAQLLLLVANNSDDYADFDHNFCRSAVGDLSFDVVGEDGHRYPLQVLLNDGCDLDSHVKLAPFSAAGKLLSIDELLSFHGAPKGNLELTALICERGEGGSRVNCLSTNRLTIRVEQ